ncbi:glutamic acid-rich protein-like [Pectinophora gossypiella]|nr:glutamic acid-rich protein-like [Pectinophora gossypiella]
MKKTTKSPESTEMTPNKKKLKQARLPFMLISDVSPKPETPQTRKRKLSVPDPEPVTKVGKTSKENTISDDLVVISDDESKGVPTPKKEDLSPKPVSPYVKLVDLAWKKKLQKNKRQKKTKAKSAKKLRNGSIENQSSQENNDNMECDDVEMMEVEVQMPENSEKNESEIKTNGDILSQKDNKPEPSNTSREIKKSPKKQPQKQSLEQSTTKKVLESKIKQNDSEIVCLDDCNNSCDDKMSNSNNNKASSYKSNKEQHESDEDTVKSDSNEKKESSKKTQNKTKQSITPKHSTRNKTKPEEANKKTPVKNATSKTDSSINKYVKRGSPKLQVKEDPKPTAENIQKDDTHNESQVISDDSDVEMNNSQNEELTTSKISETKETSQETSKNKKEESPKPTTPKRSARKKAKLDDSNLNMSTTSSKLDESMSSTPSTPNHNKSISETSLVDKSLNESIQTANLTPKQLQKRLEANKRKEEREKEKQERDKKRQQEKEERAKQRQEKEEQRKKEKEEKEEARKKEKEEKEEQKKKEKEEKEKQKEMEKKCREMKEEQKRKEREDKEEQKRKEKEAREEEKRKKQEALELEKQEQELKKKKAAEAFVNFFVPKQKVERETSVGPVSKSSLLSSFTIKVDMRLAPTTRADLTDEKREVLDKFLDDQSGSEKMYLKCLKDGSAKPLSSGKTWPLDDKDDEVMIIEDELPPIDGAGEVITCESAPREKLRPKLFSFHENRRPPYWGTWRKKSPFIKPRRPFGQDEKQLEYEVDSDDDWEDEQDGESLDGSAGGSDDEGGADDYEVDNEVFVPHGYLSDEEATMDEEEDDVLSLSPETQKARLKHLEDEFETELKKPTEKLKPRLYGLLWENSDGGKPDKCVDALWNYFEKFAMIMNDTTALMQPAPEPEEVEKKKIKKKKLVAEGETNEQSPKSEKKKKTKSENKESKKAKSDVKKAVPNQPGINSFLTKVKST